VFLCVCLFFFGWCVGVGCGLCVFVGVVGGGCVCVCVVCVCVWCVCGVCLCGGVWCVWCGVNILPHCILSFNNS